MNNMILRGGQAAGIFGVLLMVAAVLCRLAGQYVVAGVGSVTLLEAGIGATGAGCFALLWVLVSRDKN
jgi:hypothetical protein